MDKQVYEQEQVFLVSIVMKASSLDECEAFFDTEDWYHGRDDLSHGNVTYLFHSHRPAEILDHHFVSAVISESGEIRPKQTVEMTAQVLLTVQARKNTHAKDFLLSQMWLKRDKGLHLVAAEPVFGFGFNSLSKVRYSLQTGHY